MSQATIVPTGARFTCQSCGRCCRGWSVPVDAATVTRLRAHNWGVDPFERTSGAGEMYRIKLVDDRCFFLDDQNRCRIHSEISYDAKPPVCRAFPLTVFEIHGRSYGRLSFWCPTVADNFGKPLEHQLKWIKETAKRSDHRTGGLTIDGRSELNSRDLERVNQALGRFIATRSAPMADRLAAGSQLIRRLAAGAEGAALNIDRLVSAAEADGVKALANEMRKLGERSGGRRAMWLFLFQDRRPGRWRLASRLLGLLGFATGFVPLRTWTVPARATWRQVRRTRFEPDQTADELLTRYFGWKLDRAVTWLASRH